MKAIVWTAYGPPEVLELRDVEKPAPLSNEVLIRVRATTVTAGDCETRALDMPASLRLPMRAYVGFLRPKRITILGQELAGEVEATGSEVTGFEVGDRVFGGTDFGMGAYAQYVCLAADSEDVPLATMPAAMTFSEAAGMALGGLEAIHFLGKADIQPGERVLINGAGGSIGTFGVQLAKMWGAKVTAVDSAPKLEMLRGIGADHVIDYTSEDFTRNGETYDVIFDVVGKAPYRADLESLEPGGRLLLANARISTMIRGPWTTSRTDKTVVVENSSRTTDDLLRLRRLAEDGSVRPVIDRTFPLEEMVEAHRYVESGSKQGNVVITVP
jgi:NADPH:quinone reductase-like Zn-dependent oxidoreductase